MSTWKVRHEGSPKHVEGLGLAQLVEGLRDGRWEPTDEVLGPGDQRWSAIENHPKLEDFAAELEPPRPRVEEDETRLDMNAMIDVCLVLLVFFILTTSYAVLQKMLDIPEGSSDKAGPARVSKDVVERLMIKIDVAMLPSAEGGEAPEIRVEGEVVEREALAAKLQSFIKGTKKTEILLDHSPRVPHGMVVYIIDTAQGAGIKQVRVRLPKEEVGK